MGLISKKEMKKKFEEINEDDFLISNVRIGEEIAVKLKTITKEEREIMEMQAKLENF